MITATILLVGSCAALGGVVYTSKGWINKASTRYDNEMAEKAKREREKNKKEGEEEKEGEKKKKKKKTTTRGRK